MSAGGAGGGDASGGAGGGDVGMGGGPASGGGGSAGAGGTPDAYTSAVMADSPLGYWKLEELSGSSAADETGAHDAIYVTSVDHTAEGILGGSAVQLQGGFVEVADDGSVFDFGAGAFSVEVWVKLTDAPSSDFAAVSKSDAAGYALGYYGGAWSFRHCVAGCASASYVTTPELDKWTHLVGTFADGTAAIYVDGVKEGEGAVALPHPDTSLPLRFGTDSTGTDDLVGFIDDVAIFGHALAEERVQAHYALGAP